MSSFLDDVRRALVPGGSPELGPLPPLLVSMTVVTGLVDAFSYLALGHVFVANMTGNVVLLGFALVGAKGFSVVSSVSAILAFALGGVLGGRLGSRLGSHRGRHLSAATAAQGICLGAAATLAAAVAYPFASTCRTVLIIVSAVGMGIQNATARKIAVPDMTTTVLTLTITGMAADSSAGGGKGAKAGTRAVSVGAMLGGAAAGAALLVHGQDAYPLLIAFLVVAAVAATSGILGRSGPAWVTAS